MKTAIYGAGSLGTVLGAYLAKAGVDVDLITRNREHVDALNKDGAKIIGTVNMTVPVHALTPDEMTEKYELIILLTKQLDNVNVLKKLQKNMTDDCIVCTLQNGLPELSVSEVVGEDRTMGCTVAWGATLHGKGVSELTSEPDSMSFGLGRMNGQKDDKLMQVKALLEKMCPVEVEDNFMGVRWSKLLINAAFSGMSVAFYPVLTGLRSALWYTRGFRRYRRHFRRRRREQDLPCLLSEPYKRVHRCRRGCGHKDRTCSGQGYSEAPRLQGQRHKEKDILCAHPDLHQEAQALKGEHAPGSRKGQEMRS